MSDQKLDVGELSKRVIIELNLFMLVFTLLGFLLGLSVGIEIKHPGLTATVELKIEDNK